MFNSINTADAEYNNNKNVPKIMYNLMNDVDSSAQNESGAPARSVEVYNDLWDEITFNLLGVWQCTMHSIIHTKYIQIVHPGGVMYLCVCSRFGMSSANGISIFKLMQFNIAHYRN